MTMETIVNAILCVAVLLASVRLILWHRASPVSGIPFRLILLLILQPVCAFLLSCSLFPSAETQSGRTLRVATAGTPRLAGAAAGAPLIILPEAGAISGGEAVPDLATALRRHTGTNSIALLGNGLPPRDLDAARTIGVRFAPPSLPAGISDLAASSVVAPGAAFQVGGQLNGLPRASVDLIDPAGRVTDTTRPDSEGRFTLTGTARAAGTTAFTLRVQQDRRTVEQADVPLIVADYTPPRLLILAGAPGPEVKYLRRWATDAGYVVNSQIGAGGGIALGDPAIAINAATLRQFDAAIVDDRSWAAARGALMAAARDGLGLILRASGPLDAATRTQWRSLGFPLSGQDALAPLALPKTDDTAIASTRHGIGSVDSPVDIASPDELLPDVSRIAMMATDGNAPLLQDAGGAPLAQWRAVGSGRIALFAGVDSYALTLTGHRALHGDWWNALLATVGRPVAGAAAIATTSWAGERMALCGLSAPATVEDAGGRRTTVLPVQGCAAYWPVASGWHQLSPKGEARPQSFYVQPADALPVMRAARDRDATQMLRASTATADGSPERESHKGWLFPLAWLVATALLWWLERARIGRRPDTQSAT
ncbi:MAG: carboxypeptidase regulatory-like domain-containing protein [Sphingomonadaceae bacterium]|nr:carboxypeptidase regulatory-like domain-containing protein [Sphingomonadaceae bacterium]